MSEPKRITQNPEVMGGKPCIRGLCVTVGNIVNLLAAGRSREQILTSFPYLESEDVDAAQAYGVEHTEVFQSDYDRNRV